MTNRSSSHIGSQRWFALVLVVVILVLLLIAIVGLVSSYLPPDSYSLQPHIYVNFFPLLVGLIFSIYLLRTSRDKLRQPLPVASIAGLILGIFLGSIFNLPYYMGLLLAFGVVGPFTALTAHIPGDFPDMHWFLVIFWLSTAAVLLSLVLYAFVAFIVTRRTGSIQLGIWGAFLAAFVTILVSALTFVIMDVVPWFSRSSPLTLDNLIALQYLPMQTVVLSFAQAFHAVVVGSIGSAIALRRRPRRVNVPG